MRAKVRPKQPLAGVSDIARLLADPTLPKLGRSFVSRPRLVRRLEDEVEASTAIVSAPAGYGKTSLLAEWARRDARPCAWVALEARHDDPTELARALISALAPLDVIDPALESRHRDVVGAGRDRPQDDVLSHVTRLVASIGARGRHGILVLDEADALKSRAALRMLSAVALTMPAGSKLALASRVALPLGVARLRARQGLLELGPRDLAMTTDEARRLLGAAGANLDRRGVDELLARTEGWPALLSLAGRAPRADPARANGIDRPRVADRGMAGYIKDEVLNALPASRRRFLQDCSILDELSVELCDALLDVSDAAAALELGWSDSILVPLDASGTRHRCHPLVRDVLRQELALRGSDQLGALHQRASRAFEQRGDAARAIQHAVEAHDAGRVGRLLWRHSPDFLLRGREAWVQQWLRSFPDEQIAASPYLSLCAGFGYLDVADPAAAERWVRAAASAVDLAPPGDRDSLRGGIELISGLSTRSGLDELGRAAAAADALLATDSPWRSLCHLVQGVTEHLVGERPAARTHLEQGIRLSATLAPAVGCACAAQLAILDAEDGEVRRAAEYVDQAVQQLAALGLARQPLAALVFAVAAWIDGRQCRPEDAKRNLAGSTRALATSGALTTWYEVETRILMARASIQLANVGRARELLSQASRSLRGLPDVRVFHTWLDDAWADLDNLSASALAGPGSLTMAELRILRFLPTHLSFREIGDRLHVSTNTVKSQAHAVYGKLEAESRSEAVASAAELGLVEAAVV